MILTSRAAVRWPDQAHIDEVWATQLAQVPEVLVVRPDGLLRTEEEDVPVRLVGGVHLAPGATYRWEEPRLHAAEATIRIEGREGARTLVAEYRPVRGWVPGPLSGLGQAPASVRVEGLDLLRSVHTTSTLPYLAWEAVLVPATGDPVTARVRMRWLSLRFVARVRPADDGADDTGQLECELRLSGRGPWRPVVGLLLSVGGRFLRPGFEEFTKECARQATDVAEGRDPTDHADPQRRRQATEITRSRLHRALDEVERLPRWRQTSRAWTRAYDALPPAAWWPEPTRDTDWQRDEQYTALLLGHAARAQRRARIDELLDQRLAAHAEQARLNELARAADPAADAPLPIADGQIDLRWLRSPLTMWRYARALENSAPATRPEPDVPRVTGG